MRNTFVYTIINQTLAHSINPSSRMLLIASEVSRYAGIESENDKQERLASFNVIAKPETLQMWKLKKKGAQKESPAYLTQNILW